VKGFTDSLRIEAIKNGQPVSITLIKPGPIGTPFPRHGRNKTGYRAQLPPPLYAPEVTARAILHAAQHRRRSVTVGGGGKLQVLGATILPNLFDRIASRMAPTLIDYDTPIGDKEGNLHAPQGNDGEAEGRQHGRHFSTFTSAGRHPLAALGLGAALAGGAAALLVRAARGRA